MLRLARVEKDRSVAARQGRGGAARQLPDGLLEVRLEGESRDDLFLIEVATYPERRVGNQLTGDLMLVYLDRGELPEAVTLVLRPKGKYRIPRSRNLRSRHGLSSCRLKWRVVELWTIPAEDLLQTQDVGLIPWVPLTDFADPPETMMQRCREVIEQHAPPDEKANLLAVTQVLAYLRYNDLGLLASFVPSVLAIPSAVPVRDHADQMMNRFAESPPDQRCAALAGVVRDDECEPFVLAPAQSEVLPSRERPITATRLASTAGSCSR